MRNHARIAVFSTLFAAIFLLGPWLSGWYFQHHYQKMLDRYNDTQRVSVHIERFNRGWFNSTATLRVQILDPKIAEYFNLSVVDTKKHANAFLIEQHIQHGPIFYHDVKELPHFSGLVVAKNTAYLIPEIQKHMNIIRDIDYVSFAGNYRKFFKIDAINLLYPRTDIAIKIDELEGIVEILPKQQIQGDVNVRGLMFHNPDAIVLIPDMHATFDAGEKLWLGNNSLDIQNISLIENGNETFNISGITFASHASVSDGEVSGYKEITINEMYIGDYRAGPFHFNLGFDQLSAAAIQEMIESYQTIMDRGELYQSQLMRKMLMLFPSVIKYGTKLSLNDFDLNTQDGQLNIKAGIVWNLDKESIPDQFGELLSAADAKIQLKVSKPLMYRWIELASTLPWFNRVSPELEHAYTLARYETMLTMQFNTFGILDLVRQGKLKASDGKMLLALQKMNVTTMNYGMAVRELLLNKDISGETSRTLLYLYTQGQAPIETIKYLLMRNQQKVAQGMHSQLAYWIKSGYIQQKQNDYLFSFAQQKDQVKINGKLLAE